MVRWAPHQPISRRAVLFGGVLAAGAALAEGPRLFPPPQMRRIDLAALTPERFGAWQSVDRENLILPVGDTTRRFYDQEIARTYVTPDMASVMLLIAYSSRHDDRLEVHRPEVCYPANGFDIETSRPSVLTIAGADVPARTLLARRHSRTEQIAYWTRIGRHFPQSAAQQKLAVLRSTLSREPSDGVLVRLSTLSEGSNGRAQIAAFAQELIAASPPPLRRLLLGSLASAR